MLELIKPDIDFQEHFNNCIKHKESSLKTNFLSRFPLLKNAGDEYNLKANKKQLYTLKSIPVAKLRPITADNLNALYKNQMLKKPRLGSNPSPARAVYNNIILSAYGKCPFCALGIPYTVDHYLPKSVYPEFSIFPLNLVPCCRDCNTLKLEHDPASINEVFLHPYYDEIMALQWLKADVVYAADDKPTLIFFVDESIKKEEKKLYARLNFQMERLDLHYRYSTQASGELIDKEYLLKKVFDENGDQEVRDLMEEIAESCAKVNKNSWQAAMYRALVDDTRFCQMNWL